MSTALTPWAGLVTERTVPFGFHRQGERLQVSVGQSGAVCRADLRTGVIQQTAPGTTARNVAVYRFNLQRWSGEASPIVQAHPFLLLHLAVSGQVDLNELMSRFDSHARSLRTTVALMQPCVLLYMMGLERMALTLSTVYNLNIGRS